MKNFSKHLVAYVVALAVSSLAFAKSPFAYELTSYNDKGFCSTGYRSFANFGEFCMGLQERKLNRYCAEFERYQVFLEQGCFENGFRFRESVECRVSFFEKKSSQGFHFSKSNQRPIFSTRACIGRDQFGDVISRSRLEHNQVKRDLFVDIDLSFVNALDSFGESRADVNVYALEKGSDGIDVGIPIMVENGSFLERSVYGTSLKSADYAVECVRVAYCAK